MEPDVRVVNDQPPVWKRSRIFRVIERIISHVEDWLNLASVFIIMFLMFFASAEIIGRYVFNFPIPGHVEIVELIMAGVVFFGIAYTQRVDGHVRMELFVTRVLRGRSYHIAEAITTSLSLFVYLFIFIYSFKAALFSLKVGDTTAYIYWPTWPSKLAIPLGSIFLCMRFAIEIVQHTAQAIAGEEKRHLG
jgi:C4-dicarboxylate transporter DctQ subunit